MCYMNTCINIVVLLFLLYVPYILQADSAVKYDSRILYVKWRGLLDRRLHSGYFKHKAYYKLNVLADKLDNVWVNRQHNKYMHKGAVWWLINCLNYYAMFSWERFFCTVTADWGFITKITVFREAVYMNLSK